MFHRNGKRILDIRGAWDSACLKTGRKGTWFHDLRRSAVRNLERAGVSRSVAMRMTGHKTESMYSRYAIVASSAMEDGAQKLATLLGSGSEEGGKVVPMRKAE